MDIKSTDIINKKIVSKNEAEELAVAKELFFDTKNKKIAAILTDTSSGLEKAKGILLKNIESIGEAIVIKEKKLLVPANEIVSPEKDNTGKNRTLAGTTLITEEGEDLGEILEITFDSKSGQLKKAVSDDDGKKKTSKLDKIISVSPSTAVVKGKEENENNKNPIDQLRGIIQ